MEYRVEAGPYHGAHEGNGDLSSDIVLEECETLDVVINNPLSINYVRKEKKLPERHRTGNETLEAGEKIYPFTDAEFIEQHDITDEGNPPQPRSGPAPLHQTLLINLKSAVDLPSTGSDTTCDCFCTFSFDSQEFQSSVKFSALEYTWNETFEIFVHEHHFDRARRRCELESGGEASNLTISVYHWDSARTELIGRVVLDLTRILPFSSTELDLKFNLAAQSGERVMGHSGSPTQLHFTLATFPIQKLSTWQVPALADTLEAIEGGIQLKASVHNEAAAVASSEAMISTAFEFVGGKLNDVFLEWEQLVENENDDVKYWKESLANAIESLWVNAIILVLVITDVINVLLFAFDSNESDHQTPVQIGINVSIGFVFVLELSLRQLALGRRFWMVSWNIFDFVVIWFSTFAVTSRLLYEAGAFDQYLVKGTNPTSGLRILSRVAVGARVLRILLGIRRARKISGAVNQKLRTAVSQNKRRYKKHGYDLDLTYITNRVIAMSAPAFGGHTAYRNDIHVVARFLSLRHHGKFFVFNLCDTYTSSDGSMGNYHPQMLYNQVQRIPFEDHAPPLLAELIYFCQEASSWLQRDRKNVVVVHCKGGKGRTGVMIAALLMWTGHRRSALDALELFAYRRTEDFNPDDELDEVTNEGSSCMWRKQVKHNQSVEGPSQQRYVHYVEAVLYSGIDPWSVRQMSLDRLELLAERLLNGKQDFVFSFVIISQRVVVFDSLKRYGVPFVISQGLSKESWRHRVYQCNVIVRGDVRVEVFTHQSRRRTGARKTFCFFHFNTSFYEDQKIIVFRKRSIDLLHRDMAHAVCDPNFQIALHTSTEEILVGDETLNVPYFDKKKFFKLFENNPMATVRTFRKHEVIIPEGYVEDKIFLVKSGVVEGVVRRSDSAQNYHPLGTCVPDASLDGDVRVPLFCIHSEGSILGLSQFLNSQPSMAYRVREGEAEVIEVHLKSSSSSAESKQQDKGTNKFRHTKSLVKRFLERQPSWTDSTLPDVSGGQTMYEKIASKLLLRKESTRLQGEMLNFADKKLLQDIYKEAMDSTAHSTKSIDVGGVDQVDLVTFYHGVSIELSLYLERIQNEAIRMACLKAFTDRQSVVGDQDSKEQLRQSCIKTFSLPLSQRFVQSFKCHCKRIGIGKSFRSRIIFLSHYIVLDPMIFGPLVDSKALLIQNNQILKVSFAHKFQITTIAIEFAEDLDALHDEMVYWVELTFTSPYKAYHVHNLLKRIAETATESRRMSKEDVFHNPSVAYLLRKYGIVHRLGAREPIEAAQNCSSLFFVHSGEVQLYRSEGVHKVVRKGSYFGLSNYVQGKAAATYMHQTGSFHVNILLELPGTSMQQLYASRDPRTRLVCAQFLQLLSSLLAYDIRDFLKENFAGTWSDKDRRSSLSHQAKPYERKRGWMRQKGFFTSVLKERFFVLVGNRLKCFEGAEALKANAIPKRVLFLPACLVDHGQDERSFVIRDVQNNRTYEFICKSKEEVDSWIESLKDSSHQL